MNTTTADFSTEKVNFHLVAHRWIVVRKGWSLLTAIVVDFACVDILVSSAKRLVSQGLLGGGGSGKLANMILKRTGLRTEPCGTPLGRGRLSDIAPSVITVIERPLRKLLSHLRTFPFMLVLESLYRGPVSQVEGKALAMSRNTAYVFSLVSNPFLITSYSLTSWSMVLQPARKPAWQVGMCPYCSRYHFSLLLISFSIHLPMQEV